MGESHGFHGNDGVERGRGEDGVGERKTEEAEEEVEDCDEGLGGKKRGF